MQIPLAAKSWGSKEFNSPICYIYIFTTCCNDSVSNQDLRPHKDVSSEQQSEDAAFRGCESKQVQMLLCSQVSKELDSCTRLHFAPSIRTSQERNPQPPHGFPISCQLKKIKRVLISLWPFSFILSNWSREAIFFFMMSFPLTAGSFRLRTNVAQHRIPQGFEVLHCCYLLTVPKFSWPRIIHSWVLFIEIEKSDHEKVLT